jgi:hypothetical protein
MAAARAKVDPEKFYPLAEAMSLIKQVSTKFNASVTCISVPGIDPQIRSGDRGTVSRQWKECH